MKNRILTSLTIAFALFSIFIFYNQGITGFLINIPSGAGSCAYAADTAGETYTLLGNVGTCDGVHGIVISVDNVIIDCNNNALIGNGAAGLKNGIDVNAGLTGITIKNCIISNFLYGIATGGSSVSIENVKTYDDNGMTCYDGGDPTLVGGDNYCGAEASAPVVDNAPVVSLLDHPPDGSTMVQTPIDFNFTVWDDWNVSSCELWTNFTGTWALNTEITPENNQSETFNFTLYPDDGEYIWNVLCIDNATNEDWYATNYSVTINTTDVPPVITALPHPGTNYNLTENQIDFNFTVYDDWEVSSCELWINTSGSWSLKGSRDINTNVSATYNISTSLEIGTYIWNINCTDNASNSSWYATNASLIVEDPAPYISALSPATASTISSIPLNFSFTVLDNYNVSSCSLWSNFSGSWLQNESLDIQNKTEGTYNFTLNVNDGIYLWNVNCSDNSSQTSWFTNYTVTVEAVDNNLTVNLTSPSNASAVTASSTSLKVLTSDDRQVTDCTLWTNFNGSWAKNQTLNVSTPAATTTTFTVSPAYGTYIWNANCTDNGSNSVWADNNFTFTLQQATSVDDGGSSGGGEADEDDPIIPPVVEEEVVPEEEIVEEEVVPEVVVEEELFAPPVDEVKQEVIESAKRSKSEIVEVECDSDNCDEWFDDLITKMDKTLDKVKLEKNMTFDEKTNTTSVAISLIPDEDLEDFKYYQSIPKCMAIYVHLVKFKNTDFEILKDDPLIVWSFANVKQGEELDLGFDVMGNVPEDCYDFLSELLYEEQERFSSKNMFGLIAGLSVLGLVALGVTYSSKYSHHLTKLKTKGTKLFKKHSDKVDKKLDDIKERMKQL